MINPVNLKPQVSGGKGGLWGKIAGGVVGAIGGALAPFTGGTSAAGGAAAAAALSGAAAGAGLGSTVGGVAGNVADPVKVKQPTPLQNVGGRDPGVMLQQLEEARQAAFELPQVESQPLMDHIASASEVLKRNYKMGGIG